MLDGLPAWLRHLLLMLLSAVLAAVVRWLGTDATDVLSGLPYLAPFAGVIVTAAIAVLTPLTRQYGVGADQGEHVAP